MKKELSLLAYILYENSVLVIYTQGSAIKVLVLKVNDKAKRGYYSIFICIIYSCFVNGF